MLANTPSPTNFGTCFLLNNGRRRKQRWWFWKDLMEIRFIDTYDLAFCIVPVFEESIGN